MPNKRDCPSTYADALAFLGGRSQRRLTRNTLVWRDRTGNVFLRLHYTNIVKWYPDGSVEVRTGGWNTVTTRSWLNLACRGRWAFGCENGDRWGRARTLTVTDLRRAPGHVREWACRDSFRCEFFLTEDGRVSIIGGPVLAGPRREE